ncbi:unnamed protein product, partial [Amoebophrya sp. A25]
QLIAELPGRGDYCASLNRCNPRAAAGGASGGCCLWAFFTLVEAATGLSQCCVFAASQGREQAFIRLIARLEHRRSCRPNLPRAATILGPGQPGDKLSLLGARSSSGATSTSTSPASSTRTAVTTGGAGKQERRRDEAATPTTSGASSWDTEEILQRTSRMKDEFFDFVDQARFRSVRELTLFVMTHPTFVGGDSLEKVLEVFWAGTLGFARRLSSSSSGPNELTTGSGGIAVAREMTENFDGSARLFALHVEVAVALRRLHTDRAVLMLAELLDKTRRVERKLVYLCLLSPPRSSTSFGVAAQSTIEHTSLPSEYKEASGGGVDATAPGATAGTRHGSGVFEDLNSQVCQGVANMLESLLRDAQKNLEALQHTKEAQHCRYAPSTDSTSISIATPYPVISAQHRQNLSWVSTAPSSPAAVHHEQQRTPKYTTRQDEEEAPPLLLDQTYPGKIAHAWKSLVDDEFGDECPRLEHQEQPEQAQAYQRECELEKDIRMLTHAVGQLLRVALSLVLEFGRYRAETAQLLLYTLISTLRDSGLPEVAVPYLVHMARAYCIPLTSSLKKTFWEKISDALNQSDIGRSHLSVLERDAIIFAAAQGAEQAGEQGPPRAPLQVVPPAPEGVLYFQQRGGGPREGGGPVRLLPRPRRQDEVDRAAGLA